MSWLWNTITWNWFTFRWDGPHRPGNFYTFFQTCVTFKRAAIVIAPISSKIFQNMDTDSNGAKHVAFKIPTSPLSSDLDSPKSKRKERSIQTTLFLCLFFRFRHFLSLISVLFLWTNLSSLLSLLIFDGTHFKKFDLSFYSAFHSLNSFRPISGTLHGRG